MKEIGFVFDAFGQWSEHDRSKMKWRMKVGIEWMSSMAGRPKIGGRSATFSLLFSFPLTVSLLVNHHTFGIEQRGFGHMGWLPRNHPWSSGHPLAPL
jgi:hypothetical protein